MSLIQAVRAGEPEALQQVYEAHGPSLFRLAYRLMGCSADAEDVVHDVFVGLPEVLRHYEERGALQAWLKRVTARLALMKLRTRRRRREVGLDAAAAAPSPAEPATAEQIALAAALNALPDDLRVVLVLKEIEGYSHAEVGALLGITEGASRVRLMRAMRRLRDLLGGSR